MKVAVACLSLTLLYSGTTDGFVVPSHTLSLGSLPAEKPVTSLSAAVATRQAVQASAAAPASETGTPFKKKKKNKSSKKKSKRQIIEKEAEFTFTVIDLDGNGYISKDEFDNHMSKVGYTVDDISKVFQKIDANQDEKICLEEFRNAMVSYPILQKAPGLGRYNTDFVQQIHQDADQVFQSADSDGNGFVDEFEFQSHMNRRRLFSGQLSWSEESIQKIFQMLDVNKNRRVSKAEFRTAFARYSSLRFAIADGPAA